MKRYLFYCVTLVFLLNINLGCSNLTDLDNPQTPIKKIKKVTTTNRKNPIQQNYKAKNKLKWQLFWQDEFDETNLDLNKWNAIDWSSGKNQELQYYKPNNISLKNGYLNLTSFKETYRNKPYTSGAVDTRKKFDLLYGKIEMRAKLPKGKGIFPAFWTLPANDESLPEIDILEYLGQEPNKIWMVYHWLTPNGVKRKKFHSYIGTNFSKDFHTYSLEWNPQKLIWYIDGKKIYTTSYAPHQPLYLYINLAIGGEWPGAPDKTTSFPQTMIIDYVRVYKFNN